MRDIKHIGILTGGGDCPGLNSVIRAITKTAVLKYGVEVIGFMAFVVWWKIIMYN